MLLDVVAVELRKELIPDFVFKDVETGYSRLGVVRHKHKRTCHARREYSIVGQTPDNSIPIFHTLLCNDNFHCSGGRLAVGRNNRWRWRDQLELKPRQAQTCQRSAA